MIIVWFPAKVIDIYNRAIALEWKQRYYNHKQSFLFCLHAKLYITTYLDCEKLFNKRSELISKYRHENKFRLIINKVKRLIINFSFSILAHCYLRTSSESSGKRET